MIVTIQHQAEALQWSRLPSIPNYAHCLSLTKEKAPIIKNKSYGNISFLFLLTGNYDYNKK